MDTHHGRDLCVETAEERPGILEQPRRAYRISDCRRPVWVAMVVRLRDLHAERENDTVEHLDAREGRRGGGQDSVAGCMAGCMNPSKGEAAAGEVRGASKRRDSAAGAESTSSANPLSTAFLWVANGWRQPHSDSACSIISEWLSRSPIDVEPSASGVPGAAAKSDKWRPSNWSAACVAGGDGRGS